MAPPPDAATEPVPSPLASVAGKGGGGDARRAGRAVGGHVDGPAAAEAVGGRVGGEGGAGHGEGIGVAVERLEVDGAAVARSRRVAGERAVGDGQVAAALETPPPGALVAVPTIWLLVMMSLTRVVTVLVPAGPPAPMPAPASATIWLVPEIFPPEMVKPGEGDVDAGHGIGAVGVELEDLHARGRGGGARRRLAGVDHGRGGQCADDRDVLVGLCFRPPRRV